MSTKPGPTTRLHSLIILALLVGCIAATVNSNAMGINSERNLAVDGKTAEDRVIDAKLPGVAKLVEAVKSKSPFVDDSCQS